MRNVVTEGEGTKMTPTEWQRATAQSAWASSRGDSGYLRMRNPVGGEDAERVRIC